MELMARSRYAFWGDLRFLIGIALVAASIGGVWLVVSSSTATSPVLQANRTIVPGEALVSADFQVVEVNLGAVTGGYLAPQDLTSGQVAGRTVVSGELLPRDAAVAAESTKTTTIVIDSSTGLPGDLDAGSVVEIWHAPPLDESGTVHDTPRLLVADVVVAAITESEGMLASSGAVAEVVIDRTDVAAVLAAITGGSVLSVVPVGAAR
ncbi:SAF domain-containing protein [Microbacterium sp. UFMG61]|uniref:SAF domain-containing protein n=1 Tax=Microbacterium sp. UFMG61 TaxID=2745935 RepID=UPI00188FBC12|nr:SAF domain-containing protein [Microbacterium sp. UFMG61]